MKNFIKTAIGIVASIICITLLLIVASTCSVYEDKVSEDTMVILRLISNATFAIILFVAIMTKRL